MLRKWKPKYVQDEKDYFMMNDTYYSLILVSALPNIFSFGLANYLAVNPNIKLLMKTEMNDMDLETYIKRELQRKHEDLRVAHIQKNSMLEKKYIDEIESLETFVEQISRNHDRTYDLSMAFVIQDDNLKELRQKRSDFIKELRNDPALRFKVHVPQRLQLTLYKYFSPIFNKHTLINKTQEFNIGLPLGTSSFAKMYPYHFTTLDDPKGFLYGYELSSYGNIVINPMLYYQNDRLAVQQDRLTGNIVVLGESGSGKSTDMFLFIRHFIRENLFIMWIDPESQNKDFVLDNGGSYLEFGTDEFMFNPFHLIRVSDDNENEAVSSKKLWNTEQAIIQATDHFKRILELYSNENGDQDYLRLVGEVMEDMYAKKGFDKIETFEHLKATDFPILDDFYDSLISLMEKYREEESIRKVRALEDLEMKINPMLNEHRYYFNGHTTVDIELKKGGITGIGTKNLYISKPQGLINALNYIIYNHSFNYCLDQNIPSAFVFDEVHTNLKDPMTADLLDVFFRRSRKYFNLNLIGTQEPLDFTTDSTKGILGNTTYFIIKMLKKDHALNALHEMMNLTSRELERIRDFERGDSLAIIGSKKYFMHTFITDTELDSKGHNYFDEW